VDGSRHTSQPDSVKRFSKRADLYDRYRPDYPSDLFLFLYKEAVRSKEQVIVDLAAGTGIFSHPMASWPNPLYVVEPNEAMQAIARKRLIEFGEVKFFQGTAEQLDLPAHSVDLFTVAQAFHWFDLKATKAELLRVGTKGAKLAIIWNYRKVQTPFEIQYDAFIQRYSQDYNQSSQQKMNREELIAFFDPAEPLYKEFAHHEQLTFEVLWGRTQSYSFLPDAVGLLGDEMQHALQLLFTEHEIDGKVKLNYLTKMYLGDLMAR